MHGHLNEWEVGLVRSACVITMQEQIPLITPFPIVPVDLLKNVKESRWMLAKYLNLNVAFVVAQYLDMLSLC